MRVERNWDIGENETVGSLITRVRAEDNEGDELIYGLDVATMSGLPTTESIPFRIDSEGRVYLTESLTGRVS